MSGITFLMNIARGALFAEQKAIDVTGHNIANVNTPGYTRQNLILEADTTTPLARLKLGYGVVADSVTQEYDRYTTKNLQDETSTLSGYETQKSIMDHVQGLFNEATGTGLNQVMADFWNAWQDLVNNPAGIPERTALMEKADNMSQKFQLTRNDLTSTREEMNLDLTGAVSDINNLCAQLADTNDKIVAAEVNGTTANDLRDQRNNLVQKLSQYMDVTYMEKDSGAYTVMTKTGIPLVEDKTSWSFSQQGDAIYWNNIPVDVSSRLTGGKVGAWLDLRDDILPQYMANLDELAGKMVHEVNSLHYIDGYTLDGANHQYFFDHFNTVGEATPGGTWEGTSSPTSGGDYTGRLEKVYTFTTPTGTVGAGALTVNWSEAVTGRSGTITIPNAYVPGTAIHVDGMNAAVAGSGNTGTSQATASGNYTGSNDKYTFTVQSVNATGSGTGAIGTDDLVVHWEKMDGTSGNITLAGNNPGPAYLAGTPLAVDQGMEIAFSAGTLKVGDQFTVETEQGPDVSFSAGTLVNSEAFSISCADYAGAARNIALSSNVAGQPQNIAASSSSDASETGNNTIARSIQALQDSAMTIGKWTYTNRGATQTSSNQSQTLDDYYNVLVGDIGMQADQTTQNQDFHQAMIDQLNELRDSKSGVSLDEEMVNMMRYQYAYQAASRLINTADTLFQTVMGLKGGT
jgi:flagellar hook-associated protein 1